jgi:uncharacterized protein YndB with AHSA1/START domain
MKTTDKAPGRAIMSAPSELEIRLERVFNASRERVWRALTERELVAQWWGRGHKLDVEHLEVKVGGRWRFVEHSGHGEHGFGGVYREIVPPERLVNTFAYDGMPDSVGLETTILEDLGDGRTKLISISRFNNIQERDMVMKSGMEHGANDSYDALDRVLAGMD